MGTLINTTGLTRFGDMISGGGLNAVFDGNTGTSGYAQATSGYAGVDLGTSPKRIEYAEFVSQTNGFDASGLTSQITLKLYGKNGSAPTSATDGTLLGTSGAFTDVNAQQTKTVTSTDQTTQYQYVWGTLLTGVWSAAVEIRFFETTAATEPAASTARRVVYRRVCNDGVAMTWAPSEITQFRTTLQMNAAAVAEISFQANVVHRGDITGYNGAVGVGLVIDYRYATAFADLAAQGWTRVPNAVSGFNISERDPQHYGAATIIADMATVTGFYEFRVTGSAHSTGSSLDGLAGILVESGSGLNGLRIAFDKDAELLAA